MSNLAPTLSCGSMDTERLALYDSAAQCHTSLSGALDAMDRAERQRALLGDAGCALALQLSALAIARDRPDDIGALRRVLMQDVMPQASRAERSLLNDAVHRLSLPHLAVQVGLGRMPATCFASVLEGTMPAEVLLQHYALTRSQAWQLIDRDLAFIDEPKIMAHLSRQEVYVLLFNGRLHWSHAWPYLGPMHAQELWALIEARRCAPQDVYLWLIAPQVGMGLCDADARIELADRLMAQHLLPPALYRDVLNEDVAASLRLVEEGRIGFARAAGALATLRIADVQRVVDAGRGTFAQWACVARLPSSVLHEGVGQGVFEAAELKLIGHNRYHLCLALWSWGRIDDATARYYLTKHWRPQYGIAEVVRQQLLQYPDEATLLNTWALPGTVHKKYRAAWVWRCLALWWTTQQAKAALLAVPAGIPSSLVRPYLALMALRTSLGLSRSWPPAASPGWLPILGHVFEAVTPAVALPECLACLEPLTPEDRALSLPDCRHDVQMCAACFERGVQAEGAQRCPDPGCRRPLNLRDGDILGWSADQMDASAVRIASRAREAHPNFCACPTDNCPGGLWQTGQPSPHATCRFCACDIRMSKSARMRQALTPEDMQQIDLMLECASDARGNRGGLESVFMGLIRECYHCGVPTRHDGGCSHMHCSACSRDWDFVHGPARPYSYVMGAQRYVPQRSWFVDLGLYEGLTPGASNLGVSNVLAAQVAALKREREGGTPGIVSLLVSAPSRLSSRGMALWRQAAGT